jgi:hypothetical protein
MRWTGLIDHNWKNPGNWVEVKGDHETPVAWAPTGCVNVIIPSGATHYPELTDSVWCNTIVMKDRAMLKNPHVLKYANASVELKLTPAEKDRFIMWSAPLKDMYSGDYHVVKQSGGTPVWGDSYMMFFQMANPDAGVPADSVYTMTATVGHPGAPLPLGTAFNFRLSATSLNRDSTLRFPQAATSYQGSNGQTYGGLTRTDGGRFITDGVAVASDKTFTFTVKNTAGANVYPRIIQVVNPYMAWLDVAKFLAGNSATLEAHGYVAWNGDINEDLVSYYTGSLSDSLRYWIPTGKQSVAGAPAGMIPPLKSFFVIRRNGAQAQTNTLKMSCLWTTTGGAGVTTPYSLRSAAEENGILRIKATQGAKTSSALLHYNPEAHPHYDGREDISRLFYDEIPLAVYILTPWQEALAVYSDGDFSTRNIDLGLRIREAGEVTLEFSGMPTFGHDVWLIDKALGKEVDLQQDDTYTFMVVKTGRDALELDDRFVIRARYTGKGITGSDAITRPQWTVSSCSGNILVRSASQAITQLQVYDIAGALVYTADTPSDYFRVPVAQGVYIIQALIGDEQKMEKVWVK